MKVVCVYSSHSSGKQHFHQSASLAGSGIWGHAQTMRFLGVDPGLATIGVALVESESPQHMQAVDWWTITTPPRVPLSERLREIATDFEALLATAKPDCAVVERLFFAVNETTAIDVAHARGVVLQVLASTGIPILEPTPMQLKAVVAGDGSADKRQMQRMLQITLGLKELPKPDDAADALGLAVYGALQRSGIAAL
jgi:crossover junction endodeoxyribonuclease RuvC